MMENVRNIVDESFPSLLSNESSLENLTLGSTLGIPVAASTVSKIRSNRITDTQASYLEDKFSLEQTLKSEEKERFALSFKDDLGDAENFFADNCFSDMLVKVNLEESESKSKSEISTTGLSDEDIDAVHLQDELELYFDSAMQRGQVEGLAISAECENKRLNFRPGLEGGENNVPLLKSLESEHRHFEEDQAITPPVTGAVGREGSNENEENINEGMTTHPQSPSDSPSTNSEMRVKDIVDGMGADSNEHHHLFSSALLPTASIPEDGARTLHPLNPFEDTRDSTAFMSNANHSSFHLSKVLQNTHVVRQENPRSASGVSCVLLEPLQGSKEDSEGPSLDPKYLSQSFHDEEAGSWSNFPEDMDFHQGENEKQSVVYQNEEGKWVTDLAYYSSFEKELQSNPSKELSSQFQKEDFVSGSNAIEKIAEDQEVFDKEHRFIQEEQMEANASLGMGDSSWKLPASSHILMRASQISSDFERGNHSYLRLSLGEFFQQRSEALGCLGNEEDTVKRPSFGYIITSPEKREPFALIRPSDFSSRGSSFHSDTILLSDEPMNAEDLEKTLENNVDRTITNIDVQSALTDEDNLKGLNDTVMVGKDCSIKETTDLPESPNDVQLSISTIASAIANASVNSDPAQLAAMIIKLSQKSHFKVKQTTMDDQDASILPDPSSRTAAAQANIVGNISTFDIEKYLKRVELSTSDSDVYSSQSCVDFLGLTNGRDVSHGIVEPPFEKDLECGTRNSTEVENPFNEGTRTFSSRILSTSSDGTEENAYNLTTFQSDGRNVVISQPKDLPTALKMSSSLNCDLPNTGGAHLKSKLLAECKHGSPKSEVATDPATDRSKNDATMKSREVSSHVYSTPALDTWGSSEANAVKSSPEHNAPMHAQPSFRPSTSPLTHSSPSQTSIHTKEGDSSYESSEDLLKTCPRNPPFPEPQMSNLSMSRLTYLSINDGHGTPDQKKNTSMELSTTIIRASPTPEEDGVKLRKDWAGVFQDSSGNCLEPSMSPDHTQFKASDQQIYGQGAHSQNGCNFHQGTKDFPPDSRPTKNCSEIRHCAYVGDSGYTSNLNIQHQQGGITGTDPRSIVSQHWHGISGLGMQSAPTSSAYMTSDLRYAPPITNYTSRVALMDAPRTAPVPLPRGAVFSTHSGQQYLDGEMPPHMTNHLSGGHGTLYPMLPGLPGGYLNCAQIQNPHQCFSKACSQPGITQWGPIDFTDLEASVVVPDELKFPSPCCVGIASQIPLSIFNPTDRWLQVSISISSLSIDGEQVDLIPYQWIVVKNKTVVCPKSTEEQKVLFIAPRPGVYQCTINVQSWPASAEPETVTRAKLFSKRILFGGVAENPAVEVEIGKSGCLDFGDLPAGSSKALPLRLINRTHAVVPIRLFMSANATSWRCFTFSKSSVVEEVVHPAANRTTPSVVNYVLQASNGDNPGVFMIWVHFHAPQKYTSTTGELGPADELTARIDIEVDSPGPSRVIQSVGLKARSGTARVHAPRHLQTVSLQAPFGQSTQQTLPLKNAGNINVQLRLKSSDGSECFSVKPSEFMLHAGEEQGIVVSFTAKDKQKCIESVLTILVLPSGPQYEVILKGEVQPEGRGKAVHNSTNVSQCPVPPIFSNKQFMVWGGVTLGRAMQQKLVLRNNSTSVAQQLRLLVRGQDQDCFQLQSSFGPEERLSQHRELTIRPKEDMAVRLLYTPTRVSCMMAKLEIKQSSVRPSQPSIKFTIPLSGYGGTSNVILEDLEKYSEGYRASLTGVRVGSVSKLCLCVRNTGSRAAYVKAVIYTDLQKSELAETTVFSLAPSQFVLKERTKEVITVLLKTSPREQALCQSRAAVLATVCLFCGDEISRQQYRRSRTSKPQRVLSDDSLLKNVPFDEPFLGEDEIHEVCDLPQRPSDAQIFFNNMNKVLLSLLGTTDTAGLDDHLEFLHTSQRNGSELDGGFGPSDQASHVSLDVLPVKGPPLVAKEAFQNPTDEYCGSWRVKPELVVLRAPTIGGVADICQVQITNHSGCELSFELSWPAHCLTITPQNGVIEPESHMQIHISPNPSLISKPLQLPWSGHVYVLCDGQQKFVKVQIQQNMAKDVTMSGVSDKSVLPLVPQAEIPALPSAKIQPSSDDISQIEIINRILVFPITPCGESTECSLKVENKGEEVRWYLSSLAPPYVKGVDGTGDVYRATYTAFRCPTVSGTLGTQGNIQVPFTFLPRDEGDYAQFWDLECHPVGEQKQKSRLRFQLCGTGVKSRASAGLNEGDPLLAQQETSTKPRMRLDSKAKTESEEAPKRGVHAPQDVYTFPVTRLGLAHTLKVNFRNNSFDTHELTFISPRAPFHIKHSKYSLRSQHYINLPVQFKPTSEGSHVGFLVVQVGTSGAKLSIQLVGEAIP